MDDPDTEARHGPGLDRRHTLRAAALAALALPVAACGASTPSHPVAAPASDGTGPAGSPAAPSAGADPTPSNPPGEITQGPTDRPAVALTFHGQGDPTQVRQLLDALEKGGARVTVLAVGSWLSAEPAMAKRILDGGHELGNHTQNHLDIASMTASHAYTEIESCAQILKRLTGSVGAWFRPSQTQHATPTIQAQAARAGYPTCLSYNLDSLDYKDPGAPAVVRNVLNGIGNGAIVSMHCGHPGTITAVPPILDGLRQRGLAAVTVTELMRP